MSGRDELRDFQRAHQNGRAAVTGDHLRQMVTEGELIPHPNAPLDVARCFRSQRHSHASGVDVLHHWRDSFWQWRTSHWGEVEPGAIRAGLYTFTEDARYSDGHGEVKPWTPTRTRISNVADALAAACYLSAAMEQPGWLGDVPSHDGAIVSCANGLLDVATRKLLPHDPRYFNTTAVPFDYDPHAPTPGRWLRFLGDLWDDNAEQIAALQEWFGYVISGRTDLHKMLLVVGPTRGGKGVIARLLAALVGRANVAGPTLNSLQGEFGLQPLIGKSLAVVADARLHGRGVHVVVERLLSISGEDLLTVNRKNREMWTGKLGARIVICSNELPQLGDASGAIAGRFVTVLLTRSWLGKEDPGLEPELHRELPGVLNWALEGLERLTEQGRFTQSTAAEAAFIALKDLASPVGAFVRDCCTVDADAEVAVDVMWTVWSKWAESNGHRKGTRQEFGRDLRAAIPQLRTRRVGGHDSQQRERIYSGIRVDWGTELGDKL